jgi:hypothetical protein
LKNFLRRNSFIKSFAVSVGVTFASTWCGTLYIMLFSWPRALSAGNDGNMLASADKVDYFREK